MSPDTQLLEHDAERISTWPDEYDHALQAFELGKQLDELLTFRRLAA